jgi:hypothetical protein
LTGFSLPLIASKLIVRLYHKLALNDVAWKAREEESEGVAELREREQIIREKNSGRVERNIVAE